MLYVKMKCRNFVGATRRYDCQPEPKCEACLKVNTVPLGRVISHKEARALDLGHYFVRNAPDIVLVIQAQGLNLGRLAKRDLRRAHGTQQA